MELRRGFTASRGHALRVISKWQHAKPGERVKLLQHPNRILKQVLIVKGIKRPSPIEQHECSALNNLKSRVLPENEIAGQCDKRWRKAGR